MCMVSLFSVQLMTGQLCFIPPDCLKISLQTSILIRVTTFWGSYNRLVKEEKYFPASDFDTLIRKDYLNMYLAILQILWGLKRFQNWYCLLTLQSVASD